MSLTVAKFLSRKDFIAVQAEPVELPLPNTLMGVEVEVDQEHGAAVVFPSNFEPEWERKYDGSLRNGYEYVLSSPLMGQHLVNSVYKLYSEPTQVRRTYTGSTHIHINMMDGVSVEALRTMVLLSYAFETLLYYVGDNTRQWCGYASRLVSAPAEVLETIIAGDSGNAFRRATDRAGRYYGLNLQALNKYGTVEFRYFPTAESAEELISWIKLVQNFKKAALEIGTINNLISKLSDKEGYNEFVSTYFGEHREAVEACADYRKVKNLMSKAMVVANAARTPALQWDMSRLSARFNKLLELPKVTRPANVPPFIVKYLGGGAHVPPPSDVRAEGISTHGHGCLAFLAYRGGLYAACEETYGWEWRNVSDLAYHSVDYANQVLALENEVLARVVEMGHSPSDAVYIFSTLRRRLAEVTGSARSVMNQASTIPYAQDDDEDEDEFAGDEDFAVEDNEEIE